MSDVPRRDAVTHPGDAASRDLESRAAAALLDKVQRLELLHRVGVALAAEKNKERLIETILLEAKRWCHADGGTLYLQTDDDRHLRFAIMRSDSLGIALGGTTGKPIALPAVPLYDEVTGQPNLTNVASCAAWQRRTVNIADAYCTAQFDFSGTQRFDAHHGYRSTSFLTIPMLNGDDRVIGVLQLINARDPETDQVRPFGEAQQQIVEALAAQAGLALDNKLLIDAQRELLESFIKMIASAIDAKSPYTGAHCERVPILTQMLATAACAAQDGALREFELDEEAWYELKIAAWLHDCGKVTTPVHIMDKSTKLETIFDRIEVVRARFETLKRDAELAFYRDLAGADEPTAAELRRTLDETLQTLDEELAFIERSNIGGEFLSEADKEMIRRIGARSYVQAGVTQTLLSDEEVANLCISRGTLTDEERIVINGHMVHTIKMLESLPFPRNLRRVPEYAGGHHEKMDGTGYPRGLYASDMSVPARIMAIADVFEALTALDRPYKKGKKLSEAMRIMGFMKRDNHLDPDLFDLFVTSGVYRAYADKYLPPDLIDEVDEAALLAIRPQPYELPSAEERAKRWKRFLAQYDRQT